MDEGTKERFLSLSPQFSCRPDVKYGISDVRVPGKRVSKKLNILRARFRGP